VIKNLSRLQTITVLALFSTTLAGTAEPASSGNKEVPFERLLRTSRNPFDAYRGRTVEAPGLANSPRLDSLVRNGKLYLSLRDAIDLAMENNLDLVIARYNLPIAQTDILRTASGGSVRGVNTGVVQGTPGGEASGSGSGSGAGGTSSGAGGAGAGASGMVTSTLGTGTAVSSYDPAITAKIFTDHTSEQLTNFQSEGVSIYKFNTAEAKLSYAQAFATGTSLNAYWTTYKLTSNGVYDYFSPSYSSSMEVIVDQKLLAGFGPAANLRYLRIAKTNQKVSDVAFRAQVIATVTQVCNLYWDLVDAYEKKQVSEHSVEFAQQTLDSDRKQLALQAIPEMEVLKAEGELATREQNLTIARTSLQLQELYMKNALTRSLDDSALEEMPVIPTDRTHVHTEAGSGPLSQMVADALRSRTELQESALVLQNNELSRKTARNALLPSLDIYGLYAGTGTAGTRNPRYYSSTTTSDLPASLGSAMGNAFNNTAPEYQVGVQLSIPLRNRAAKADQERTELEYRQSQVYFEELKKRIRIEVRSAQYALEQGASRVEAARKARSLAERTLDIMQKEQQLGAGSNQQTLAAEHDLALASSALVTAETAYEKAILEVRRATGAVLEEYGISIADARAGVAGGSHLQ